MEAQFNFQLRQRNDKREWEDIEVYYPVSYTHLDVYKRQGQHHSLKKIFLGISKNSFHKFQ